MKKSEFTQLTQIIEHLVAKEVRKQLPTIISETFQNMMGKSVVTEKLLPSQPNRGGMELEENIVEDEPLDFKSSLKELFAGTPVMRTPKSEQEQTRPIKQFAKDPKINQILNETVSDLRYREHLVGGAAMAGGYSPSLNLIPGFDPNAATTATEDGGGASFMKNTPPIPRSRPQVFQEGSIPAASVPIGTSPAVANALTKNYSQMMKLIDKKKRGTA